MSVVGARLVVLMAVDAFKCTVIGLVRMAVGTGVPGAGAVMASRTDGEPLVMGKKCRRLPGESTMTDRTIGVEFRGGMPGTGSCSVFPEMARHARDGRPPEPVLGMACLAGE
jgi:hypothetical protein